MHNRSIAVIGAGFSGTLLAIQLRHRVGSGTRIHLIEKSPSFGGGLAYSTAHEGHVLNVPANRMGAFPDRPDDFLAWLRAQPHASLQEIATSETAFVPRRLYGDYLRSLLASASRDASLDGLNLIHDDVVDIVETERGLDLAFSSGGTLLVDAAVLAIGNFPAPTMCAGLEGSAMWRSTPWNTVALSGIDPSSRVLLVGTGLTMVDTAVALLDGGHTGPIHAVSRRGLLPRVHSTTPVTAPASIRAYPIRLGALTRLLRREASQAIANGQPWQAVIDALRPVTQELWQAMSLTDKRRFLRHVRCWWDIYRHRMAPSVAKRIDEARASGQLRITAGRIIHCEADHDRLDILIRDRGTNNPVPLRVARAINCTGLTSDVRQVKDRLLRTLLDQGLARPDPLSLGLDVSQSCALIDRTGASSGRLYAIGPITKGVFWEMVAVPDIRRQCDMVAQHLAETLVDVTR